MTRPRYLCPSCGFGHRDWLTYYKHRCRDYRHNAAKRAREGAKDE